MRCRLRSCRSRPRSRLERGPLGRGRPEGESFRVSVSPALAIGSNPRPELSRGGLGLVRAGATLLAAIASFATLYAVCRWCGAQTSPAILAAIVAIGLSRRANRARRLPFIAVPIAAAGVAVTGAGIGQLLRLDFAWGALAFTAGIFISIWLRNFDERGRALGALLALPLIGMLVVPARAAAPGGPLVDLAIIIAAGVVPFASVAALRRIAGRVGIALVDTPPTGDAEGGERQPSRGISVPTRMAIQTAIAVAAAFVLGWVVFRGHWSWAVLTAYIVCSGARGRGDAAHTGLLRLAGAVSGTLAAAVLGHVWAPTGALEAGAIFVILFFGVWLRDVSYAWWAGCMTLILALLSGSNDGVDIALLAARLEAILAGALCGVAAAWFIFPIRTEAVIRRRIADALRALDDLVAHANVRDAGQTGRIARFAHRMLELDRVAPPVRWHRRIFAFADRPEHPGRWIEVVDPVRDAAHRLIAEDGWDEQHLAAIRRAIGAARRAIAHHGKPDAPPQTASVSAALAALGHVFTLR
jgi:hypothetical protein